MNAPILSRRTLLAGLLAAGCKRPARHSVEGRTMGTTWSLQAEGAGEPHRRLIQDHLDAREALFSHWREDSTLSRFNRHASGDWFPVPAAFVQAVQLADAIHRSTGGALDPTCAPLIDAWGFGRRTAGSPPPSRPDEATLDRLRSRCGWRNLEWRNSPPALRKHLPDLQLNLASVVEGFVLDELQPLLEKAGLHACLLEIGGEVAAWGEAPGGGPWKVGIQTPGRPRGETLQSVDLHNECAATSGSYREQRRIGGSTISHLIDPRTGHPVRHNVVSVTVVHASAAWADGLATALMILGPDEGRAVAARLGIRSFWLAEP